MARGKKYQEALSKIDRTHQYDPTEALNLLKETVYTKFDPTVELHFRLGVDPRQADQQVRDVVVLPHGLGKTVRVLVFAEGEAADAAEEAGADYIADDELIGKIQDGWVDFDVAIATTNMMGQVGRLGRVLGPRGLMPNPKAGTVVAPEDLAEAVNASKAGRVEFRIDKTANLHVPIGKASFGVEQLYDNMAALMDALKKNRPASSKGQFIRKITLCATMGPGIKVDPAQAVAMEA